MLLKVFYLMSSIKASKERSVGGKEGIGNFSGGICALVKRYCWILYGWNSIMTSL